MSETNRDVRRYARFEMLEYALVFFQNEEEAVRAVIVDIGLGGLQIRTRNLLPIGESCIIQVAVDDGDPLELRGEVRHSTQVADSEIYASGFRFVPETHEERMAIANYVHAVFLRQGERAVSEATLDF
jgi:c-di-GMP-binding flagellar brake protein YcgR